MTKKQENSIYWKMLEEMTGKNREWYNGHIRFQFGFCEALGCASPFDCIEGLSALQLFNPNDINDFWFNDTPEENYNARLTALCFAIAMTE